MHWDDVEDLDRALTAAWIVEYVYPLPTERQPAGGEVRLARFSSGAAKLVATRATKVIKDRIMIDLE